MNAVRVPWMVKGLGRWEAEEGLKGLRVLDVGCGAGILSEALGRLGAEVLGLDAVEEMVAAAEEHRAESGDPRLAGLSYQEGTVEQLAVQQPASFDVRLVLSLLPPQ